ncbi:MAG: Tad domain-containing protein [Planctomycetota bacterium]|nr:Tad domain-containing protein [Planctomycetota bacterium]
MKNLHHDERSTVTVGFLFLMVPLYLCIAAIWNTGSLVDQKMRAQALADSVALSAASQMSHSINQMIMLNMLALRAKSAEATALRCLLTAVVGGAVATANLLLSTIPPPPAPNPYFDPAEATIAGLDIAFLAAWAAKIGKVMASNDYQEVTKLDIDEQQKKVNEKLLKRMYQQISDINEAANNNFKKPGGVGDFLDDVRDARNVKRIETYKIYVAHKDADIYHPESEKASSEKIIFKETEYHQRLAALTARVILADGQWAKASKFNIALDFANDKNLEEPDASWLFPALRSHKFFEPLKSKKPFPISVKWMTISLGWYGMGLASSLGYAGGQWGYVFDEDDRDLLQVAVIVEKSDDIPFVGGHLPDNMPNYSFMATGFFRSVNERKVIAMAQAETYNTYYRLIKNLTFLSEILGGLNDSGLFRWMQWASLGANYQARLTRIDSQWLGAVKADKFKSYLEDTLKLKSGDANVFLH